MWLGLFDTIVLIEEAEYENNYIYPCTLNLCGGKTIAIIQKTKRFLHRVIIIATALRAKGIRIRQRDEQEHKIRKMHVPCHIKITSQDCLLILASNCKGCYFTTNINVYRATIAFPHSASIVIGTDNGLRMLYVSCFGSKVM